jgi:hypothetical protein
MPLPEHLVSGYQDFVTDAGGVAGIYIARPDQGLAFAIAALAGDRAAEIVTEAVGKLLVECRRHRPMCLCCERRFSRTRAPAAIALVFPYREDPSTVIGFGVCASCSRLTDEELVKHIARLLEGRLLPTPEKKAGRA